MQALSRSDGPGAATPLVVFAYNRPEHLRRCLESLGANPELARCRVTIRCDGPKGEGDAGSVRETAAVARAWAGRHGALVEVSDVNMGLAPSIISGVGALCRDYGRAIVVEDDLVVAPGFVRFMLDGLDRFEKYSEVYQVNGYMFGVAHPPKPESFFLPWVSTWGWATWQRAWVDVDWTAAGALERLKDTRVQRAFDLNGNYPYTDFLKARLAGRNSSWGILWWWHVFSRKGLSLFPARTLVANKGFDGTGHHCPDGDWRGGDDLEGGKVLLELPNRVRPDLRAYRRVIGFIGRGSACKTHSSWQSLVRRVLRKIRGGLAHAD
ncbi:MAG: hypothetical protein FJ224_07345 [Lentisphaerae bacterium]|nr:hypothetical protein [Lentisphaerota bacterium]